MKKATTIKEKEDLAVQLFAKKVAAKRPPQTPQPHGA